MTKREAFEKEIKERSITDYEVDYALPIQWIDNCTKKLKIDSSLIVSNFVWLYEKDSIWGRPFPITKIGNDIYGLLVKHELA